MGNIWNHILFFSNLVLVLGTLHHSDLHLSDKYEKEKQENYSLPYITTKYPPRKENDFFSKQVKNLVQPLNFHGQKRSHYSKITPRLHKIEPPKKIGLSSYLSEDSHPETKRRDLVFDKQKSGHSIFRNVRRKNIRPGFPQNLSFQKDIKKFPPPEYYRNNFSKGGSIQSYQNDSKTFQQQNAKYEEKYNSNKRFVKEERSGRFYNSHGPSKVCDPCNSVPWIPLFKVPNSYRQQRNRPIELHKPQHNTLSHELPAFSSSNQNIVLPSSPLIPPPLPIYDGTISSSLGLPLGNIPTSHGLSPPLNHLAPKVNKYGVQTFGTTLNYFPMQSILESSPFPELSPVPIVPIHDSGSFFKLDNSIPDLVPPLVKPVSSSNVVLTIAEQNSTKIEPSVLIKTESENIHAVVGKDSVLQSHSQTDYSQYTFSKDSIPNQNAGFQNLEIVKSIPIAEFSSSLEYEVPLVQLPLANEENYPPFYESSFHTPIIQSPPVIQNNLNHNFKTFSNISPPLTSTGVGSHNTNFSKFEVLPYLNPPRITNHILKESENLSSSTHSVPKPLSSHSLSWLFPEETNTLTSPTVNLEQSFVTETQEIASVVNRELHPVKSSSSDSVPSNSDISNTSKTKKIQIIIPYTTKSKNSVDSNALGSTKYEVYQTLRPPINKSLHENDSLHVSITSTLSPLIEQVRQHNLEPNRERKIFNQDKRENDREIEGEHSHLSEMHHIIATNIRELLQKEIEKTQTDQNVQLQNNIDNWTALEYSNHKTTGTKAPQEIITQALAVTSIPGTSISHLLLPSKKIPKEYFATTPLPIYDEPTYFPFNATNTSVNSRPFTAKPYATTSLYFPTPRDDSNKSDKQKQNRDVLFSVQSNHGKNYTEVNNTKTNNWSRLSVNSIVPHARETIRNESINHSARDTTPKSTQNRNVHIVTPLPYFNRNYTLHPYKRTTRNIHTTEGTIKEKMSTANTFNIRSVLKRYNSTKLEKVSNWTSKGNFSFKNSTDIRQNQSVQVLGLTKQNFSESINNSNSVKLQPVIPVTKNFTSVQLNDLHNKTNNSEKNSINDIFPFRNKELPWESNLEINKQIFQNNRQGKGLIRQVKNRNQQKTTG